MVHVAGTVKSIKVQATESVSKALMSVDVQDASYPSCAYGTLVNISRACWSVDWQRGLFSDLANMLDTNPRMLCGRRFDPKDGLR